MLNDDGTIAIRVASERKLIWKIVWHFRVITDFRSLLYKRMGADHGSKWRHCIELKGFTPAGGWFYGVTSVGHLRNGCCKVYLWGKREFPEARQVGRRRQRRGADFSIRVRKSRVCVCVCARAVTTWHKSNTWLPERLGEGGKRVSTLPWHVPHGGMIYPPNDDKKKHGEKVYLATSLCLPRRPPGLNAGYRSSCHLNIVFPRRKHTSGKIFIP